MTTACRNCPVQIKGICPGTDSAADPFCEVRGRQVAIAADQVIRPSGSDWGKISILRSGLVRVQRFALEGRRHILSLVLPGEVLGLDRQDGMTYESVTDSVVCQVDRRMLAGRARSLIDCAIPLYKQQVIQLERLRWMTWFIGALAAEERICAFLALAPRFMPTKANPDGSLHLTMQLGRADLADFLGTTPETISRVTHKLQGDGILAIHNAQCFSILDLDGLTRRGQMASKHDLLPFGRAFPRINAVPQTGGAEPCPADPFASPPRAARPDQDNVA